MTLKWYYLPIALFLGISGVFVSGGTARAAASTDFIERELMCQCGCTMVVDVCDCEQANQIRALISEKLEQGQSKEEIIAYFVGQYGEKVLSAPTKKGFNLIAWVLPFAAIAAGGTGLYFLLRAWSRRGRPVPEGEESAPVTDDSIDEYRQRFQEEFRRFSEEEKR